MSSRQRPNNYKRTARDERRYTVHGVRRTPVDLRKFSRALLELAAAEAERQAQAEHTASTQSEATSKDNQDGGRDDR